MAIEQVVTVKLDESSIDLLRQMAERIFAIEDALKAAGIPLETDKRESGLPLENER